MESETVVEAYDAIPSLTGLSEYQTDDDLVTDGEQTNKEELRTEEDALHTSEDSKENITEVDMEHLKSSLSSEPLESERCAKTIVMMNDTYSPHKQYL